MDDTTSEKNVRYVISYISFFVTIDSYNFDQKSSLFSNKKNKILSQYFTRKHPTSTHSISLSDSLHLPVSNTRILSLYLSLSLSLSLFLTLSHSIYILFSLLHTQSLSLTNKSSISNCNN